MEDDEKQDLTVYVERTEDGDVEVYQYNGPNGCANMVFIKPEDVDQVCAKIRAAAMRPAEASPIGSCT